MPEKNRNIIDLRRIAEAKRSAPNVIDLKKQKRPIAKPAQRRVPGVFPVPPHTFPVSTTPQQESVQHTYGTPARPEEDLRITQQGTTAREQPLSPAPYVVGTGVIGSVRRIKKPTLASWLVIALLSIAALGVGVWLFVRVDQQIKYFKSDITAQAKTGIGYLLAGEAALKDNNLSAARQDFVQAQNTFVGINRKLSLVKLPFAAIGALYPNSFSGDLALLDAASNAANAGISATDMMHSVESLKGKLKEIFAGKQNIPIYQDVHTIRQNIGVLSGLLAAINKDMQNVPQNAIPAAYQGKFTKAESELSANNTQISSALADASFFLGLFDTTAVKNYLVMFENPAELRPTGGFMGTYGLLSLQNGTVTKFTVDGIYNPDGQMTRNIIPPFPLQAVTYAWQMHDANWFPDYPTSAREIETMYRYDGGSTTDGVIAINANFVKGLLGLTGPIPMPQYHLTIDQNNFDQDVQYQVEIAYNKQQNKPKQILSDLMPLLAKRLFSVPSSAYGGLASLVQTAFQDKEILMYFNDPQDEQFVTAKGWSGALESTAGDYLDVVDTNIDGYKSDLMITENVSYTADISANGAVTDSVTVSRTHTGGNSPYYYYNKPNIDFMRIYVPLGAQLVDADGFVTQSLKFSNFDYQKYGFSPDPLVQQEESAMTYSAAQHIYTYTESGKTVFAGWVVTDPGTTSSVSVAYRMPRMVALQQSSTVPTAFTVLMQKEPGKNAHLSVNVSLPAGYQLMAANGTPLNVSTVSFTDLLNQDKLYTFGIAKP